MSADPSGYPYGASSRNPFNYSKVEQLSRDVSTAWLGLPLITNHLNLFDDTSQDGYIASLELATRFAIEDYLGMSIFSVGYRVYYGAEGLVASPTCLDLPEVSQNASSSLPGVTITKVAYYNSSNVLTVVDPSIYYFDASGNKVVVSSLPTDINSSMTAPIIVEYNTTPNPLQTYPAIQQAALLLLTHFYNNRSNTTSTPSKDIPFGVDALLRPYKPLVM